MNLKVKITGPAWLWMNSTAEIIAWTFWEFWYDVVWDNEYQSLIKWWLNYFDLFINEGSKYLSKYSDIIISFNDKNLENTIWSLKKWWFIIINKKWSDKLSEKINFSDYNLLDMEISDKYDNTYLLGIFFKTLWISLKIVLEKVEKVFKKKWEEIVIKNQNIIKDIYENYEIKNKLAFEIKNIWDKKEISYGNKMLAYWAINCWLEYYSAYPMTPASTLLTEIINSKKVRYLQAEDEISVINSALWASFTGKRSMVWTSWWWFALMTEALSFAVQAEFPIVAVLSQRAWPSTWTPTFHEQWDLNYALNPTFWDFDHIVLCPSSLEETHYFWWLSLNLADIYQSVVIFLMDKQSSEMHWTIWDLDSPEVDRWVILDEPSADYKRYELTENWVSPRVKVWTKNGDFIATSYEHDEYWATTEDPDMKVKMTEKRWKKLSNFWWEQNFRWYEIINKNARKLIICHSFTSYTAKEFIKQNPEFWLIIIKFFKPLDKRLRDELIWKEEIIFVENSYSGQMENYIVKELWLNYIDWLKVSHLRKYDLYPFYIEDFESLKDKS